MTESGEFSTKVQVRFTGFAGSGTHRAINSIGYGKALLQKWKDSVITHSHKKVDETAAIIEIYIFLIKYVGNFT